jgi:hypothetical protein
MDRLQRNVIFMNNAKHAKFIQSLEPNLRPFGGSSSMESNAEDLHCLESSQQSELPGPSTKKQRLEYTEL